MQIEKSIGIKPLKINNFIKYLENCCIKYDIAKSALEFGNQVKYSDKVTKNLISFLRYVNDNIFPDDKACPVKVDRKYLNIDNKIRKELLSELL